jgi:signal peptidase I
VGKRLTTVVALAATAIGLAAGRNFTRFAVAEESMAPALLPGDYLVARRLRRPLRRGDVVVLAHPTRPSFYLVKRVVGLPGEKVDIGGGRVHIDGRPQAEGWANGPTLGNGSWRLGPAEAFVLGDSRALSADDSRIIGPVPLQTIEWRAVVRYWPLGRAGRPAAID